VKVDYFFEYIRFVKRLKMGVGFEWIFWSKEIPPKINAI
jgi:hypothetical protein